MTELSISGVSSGAGKTQWVIPRQARTRVLISATAGLLFLLLARWWLVDLHGSDRRQELRELLHWVLKTTRASIEDWASAIQRQTIRRSQREGVLEAVRELAALPPHHDLLAASPASTRLRKLLLGPQLSVEASRPLNDYLLVSPPW